MQFYNHDSKIKWNAIKDLHNKTWSKPSKWLNHIWERCANDVNLLLGSQFLSIIWRCKDTPPTDMIAVHTNLFWKAMGIDETVVWTNPRREEGTFVFVGLAPTARSKQKQITRICKYFMFKLNEWIKLTEYIFFILIFF